MAIGKPVKDGVEITSEGPASLSLPKHVWESFRTQPLLDLTTATFGKSRGLLYWYNGEASLKALEAKRPIDGDPQSEVLKQQRQILLQGDLSFLLGDKRHCFKTAYEAKELKPESENLPRHTTLDFPEGIKDMAQGVDDKILRFLSDKRQLRPDISSADKPLQKDSGHAQLSVKKEEKKVHFNEDQTVSKATHEIALAVAQSRPGILNTTISQVTVNNSTMYGAGEGHKTNRN